MAEAIVPHMLSNLRILRSDWGVASKYGEEDLHELKDSIESLDAFLKKANSMETTDGDIKASMKLARDFIYASQEAIDDLMRNEPNRRLGRLLPDLDKLFRCTGYVSQANNIGRVLNNYSDRQKEIHRLLRQLSDAMSSPDGRLPSYSAFSESDNQLEGIDDAKDHLVQWLTQEDDPKVIFVHGAQGVGKTSLVAAVLRNEEVKKRFKYCVWIEDLGSSDMLMHANGEIWDLTTKDHESVPLRAAFQRMRNDTDLSNNRKRWVLILDDVRKPLLIESLRSHLDPTWLSVLITTRDSSLELCAKELAFASSFSAVTQGVKPGGEAPHSLNGFLSFKHVSLSMDHSLQLFRRKMLSNGDVPKNAFKSILKTCEGLPLAILATCHLLEKLSGCNGAPQSAVWERVSGRLGEELLSTEHPDDLTRRLTTLRMDQLHDVRACLFYMSIFPLDRPIRCSPLMRLWMAERFAMQEDWGTDQAIADRKLRKLLDHNFIQEVEKTSYGRTRTFRVHNLLHEFIMKKSKDDEFAMIVRDQEEGWPETIWRLSFHGSLNKSASADVSSETSDKKDESQIDKDGTKFRRLRSLLVFGIVCPEFMEKLLEQVDRLNVLHLEASSLNSFPKGILRLKYLRYLKLSGTHVKTIPEDIRHLALLETLDLKGTCVRELPDGILELKALCHLLVYRSVSSDAVDPKLGVMAPSALGDLKSLQNLCMIELNPVKPNKLRGKRWKREQLLGELSKLTSLRRLGISMLRSEDVGLLCSSLEKLIKLEALRLIAASEEIIDLSQERKAPACLQRVHLTGCFKKLSNWLRSLDSLVKLILKRSQLNGDALQRLGELRGLKHLELQQAIDVSEMTFEKGWFSELRFLGLDNIDSLESIIVNEEALPTLEILSLAQCPSLKRVPQDITRPKKLTCLELLDMPEEFKRAIEGNAAVYAKMTVKVCSGAAAEAVVALPQRPPAGNP